MSSEDDDDLVAVCNQVKTSKEYVIIIVGVLDNILAVEVSATHRCVYRLCTVTCKRVKSCSLHMFITCFHLKGGGGNVGGDTGDKADKPVTAVQVCVSTFVSGKSLLVPQSLHLRGKAVEYGRVDRQLLDVCQVKLIQIH